MAKLCIIIRVGRSRLMIHARKHQTLLLQFRNCSSTTPAMELRELAEARYSDIS
jgi:hypothetical protein